LESARVVADAAVMTVRDERRTKVVAAARATVRSRSRGNGGWGAAMKEESGTFVGLAVGSMQSGSFFFWASWEYQIFVNTWTA
jgi:hypothetical protein